MTEIEQDQLLNKQKNNLEKEVEEVPMMVDLVENKEQEIARAADPYYDIRIYENYVDDNICCDICLEFDHDLDNKIVLCDLCNVAVH